jgi:hypothetical protein
MARLALCLVLCVVFGILYSQVPTSQPEEDKQADQPIQTAAFRPGWLTVLATSPCGGLAAGLPWTGLVQVGLSGKTATDPLPFSDPLVFMEECVKRYDKEIQSYTTTLEKRERVAGTLRPREVVEAAFREKPFSVFMKWRVGGSRAHSVLWVEGENDGKMLARPPGILGILIVKKALDAPDVKSSGRYGIDEFGLQKGTERTLSAWKAAAKRKALTVVYEGIFQVKQAGDRHCYKLHRKDFPHPEEDEINDVVIYIDTETWLQVGSVLKRDVKPGEDGKLVGEYFFRDVRVNPTFSADQFTVAALKR